MGLGTWRLAQGQLTLGGLLVFLALISRLYSPIHDLSRLGNTFYSASASAERIIEFRPGATDAEIVAAARAADADDFIRLLPDGYDTMVGQRGRTLSGGQRQRLAIARAMIRDAPVLLLDEPTTGLDARSGLRVMDPLRRLMAGRTTVVISHNLLTVRDATRIVVLDHGRVLETGTHDDLIGRGGTYAGLHRLYAVPGPARAAGPLPGTVPS
jgi:ABC-type multidrug transport system fused ATPase/permease subunit